MIQDGGARGACPGELVGWAAGNIQWCPYNAHFGKLWIRLSPHLYSVLSCPPQEYGKTGKVAVENNQNDQEGGCRLTTLCMVQRVCAEITPFLCTQGVNLDDLVGLFL